MTVVHPFSDDGQIQYIYSGERLHLTNIIFSKIARIEPIGRG